MGIIGGTLGYRMLRWLSKDGNTEYCDGSAYARRSKIEVLLGPSVWDKLRGKTVIDFGCGSEGDAVEIASEALVELSASTFEKAS